MAELNSTLVKGNLRVTSDLQVNGSVFMTDVSATSFTENGTTLSNKYLSKSGGALTGSLEIFSTGSSWDEGIRIHPASNNWSGITLCEASNTGSSGTSNKTWSIHNNEGVFGAYKNGSNIDSVTIGFTHDGNNWKFKGGDIYVNSSGRLAYVSEIPSKTSDLTNDSGFITGVAWSDVTGKPSFATVATSGSYTDLSDKPTIPTVNNATLTIQKNGTTVKTFTANASTDVTCNITVPTNTNELTNGAGFITSSALNDYLPLTGGILRNSTGNYTLELRSSQGAGSLKIATNAGTDYGSYTADIYDDDNGRPKFNYGNTSKWIAFVNDIPSIPSAVPYVIQNSNNYDPGNNNFGFWKGNQSQYNSLPTKRSNVIYFIT